jgi:tetratricopeptide (TPR) repeat protein
MGGNRPENEFSAALQLLDDARMLDPGVIASPYEPPDQSQLPGPARTLDADAVSYAAGLAYRRGEYDEALQLLDDARVLDLSRTSVWAERAARVRSEATRAASQPGRRLSEIVEARLTAAGVTADNPGVTFLREWNAAAEQREQAREEGAIARRVQNIAPQYWQAERDVKDTLARLPAAQREAGQ